MKIFSKRWFSALLAAVILLTTAGISVALDKSATEPSLIGEKTVFMDLSKANANAAQSGFVYNGVTYKSRYERTLAEDGFIYGMVQPWEGNSIGLGVPSTLLSKKTFYDEEVLRETLENCKAMGINCMKIWVFQTMYGLDFDEYGNATVQPAMLEAMEKYLQLARDVDIGLALTIFPHYDYSLHREGKDKYDIGTQFMFDPEKRQGTMDNVLKPFCEVVKKYEDTVTMLEIICEPEGDIMDEAEASTKPYGTTWDNAVDFIAACSDTIHSIMPNMPVTVASGNGNWNTIKRGYYNKMKLDIIGNDVYNDDGELPDLSTLKLNAPVILGEFGSGTKGNWSDEFQIKYTRALYDNAKEKGYVGAFAWHLGYKHQQGSLESLTYTNPDGTLRPAVAAIHFMTLDNKYERTGETPDIDKPVFLGGRDAQSIRFYGSRTADRYEIYRSTDQKNWTLFGAYDAFEIDNGYYICEFSDKTGKVGNTYYYMVKAISDMDETETYSDSSAGFFVTTHTCAPEDNYIKNFDFSDKTDLIPDSKTDYSGWSLNWVNYGSQITIETIEDEYFGNTPKNVAKIVGTGNYDGFIQTGIKLKPQTKYTFTFTAKGELDPEDLKGCTIKVSSYEPTGEKNLLGLQLDIEETGEWYTYSATFKTRDYNVEDGVTVYFGEHFGTWYLTDVYLFETPVPNNQ